jgi:hypothetical protein
VNCARMVLCGGCRVTGIPTAAAKTITLATCGFNKSYNQAALVPSSHVTHKVPLTARINSRMVVAFVWTLPPAFRWRP